LPNIDDYQVVCDANKNNDYGNTVNDDVDNEKMVIKMMNDIENDNTH